MVGDRATAEEITLDVFTRVWEKADTYRPERAKVSTWLTSVTRYRLIDVLSRESSRVGAIDESFETQRACLGSGRSGTHRRAAYRQFVAMGSTRSFSGCDRAGRSTNYPSYRQRGVSPVHGAPGRQFGWRTRHTPGNPSDRPRQSLLLVRLFADQIYCSC